MFATGAEKENSPHPDSPVNERYAFPSGTQGRREQFSPLQSHTPSPKANQITSPQLAGAGGGSRLDRGRTTYKEPLKTGEEPRQPLSTSPKKFQKARSKSRQREVSGASVPSDHDASGSRRQSRQASSASIMPTPEAINSDFAQLLDQMEVSKTIRFKLEGLDSTVKFSMLKGKETMTLSGLIGGTVDGTPRPGSPSKMRSPLPLGGVRKSTSSGPSGGFHAGLLSPSSSSTDVSKLSNDSPTFPKRGPPPSTAGNSSFVMPNGGNRTRTTSFSSLLPGHAHSSSSNTKETPSYFATYLKTNASSLLAVAVIKRMRAVLATESPSWINEFANEHQGYSALIARLQEVLEMEWREEQHDDMLLHELLRCLIGLSTSDCGRVLLKSLAPVPFAGLTDLMFSEKKPGDLPTRKLIVDLLVIFASLDLTGIVSVSKQRAEISSGREGSTCEALAMQSNMTAAEQILLTLLHNPKVASKEALVDFISASHTSRPFKVYVTEMTGVARDYFWVFCHAQNRYWRLSDVDEASIEGPKVPGGMTGGVEFEAMGYLTAHMRLLNLTLRTVLVKAVDPSLAHEFCCLLFASGIERLVGVLRRASQTYYQPLHLELSRFFDLAEQAHFSMPASLAVWHTVSKSAPLLQVSLDGVASPKFKAPTSPAQEQQQQQKERPAKRMTSPSFPSPPMDHDGGSQLSASPALLNDDKQMSLMAAVMAPSLAPSDASDMSAATSALSPQNDSSVSPRAKTPLRQPSSFLASSPAAIGNALSPTMMSAISSTVYTDAVPSVCGTSGTCSSLASTVAMTGGAWTTAANHPQLKQQQPKKQHRSKHARAQSLAAAGGAHSATTMIASASVELIPARTPPSASQAPRFPNPYSDSTSKAPLPARSPLSPQLASSSAGGAAAAGNQFAPSRSFGLMPGSTAVAASATPSMVGSAIRQWEQRVSSSSTMSPPIPSPPLAAAAGATRSIASRVGGQR